MSETRMRVPRLTSRSAIGWVVGTLVVAVVEIAYVVVTQPQNWWAGAVVTAVLLLGVTAILGSRQWVDPRQRNFTWQRFWVLHTTVPAAAVEDVRLISNRAGGVLLSVRVGRRRRHLPVLLLSQYVRASQSPELCLALAEVVAAMTGASGKPRSVADELRAQARSLESGAPPERSALASRAGDRFTRIAGGGGALGGGTSQLP